MSMIVQHWMSIIGGQETNLDLFFNLCRRKVSNVSLLGLCSDDLAQYYENNQQSGIDTVHDGHLLCFYPTRMVKLSPVLYLYSYAKARGVAIR
jgi:hypothetical protein